MASGKETLGVFMTVRTIAMAQIATRLGDVDANLALHLEHIDRAKSQGAELVVFPELSLTGYVLQDLTPAVARQPVPEDPTFGPLLKSSKDLDMIVGFVEADDRHRFFIAAAYLSQGRVLHVHRKVYLPTYGLFDEGRFFAWGDQVRAFDSPFGRIGMLICEDFWHASPPYLLWLDGAEILFLISASPGRGISGDERLESARWVERINQAYASLFTTYVIHTNRVGFEDGLHFWGGATAFDPDGRLLARGPDHEPALTVVQLDMAQLHRTRARLPLLRDERTRLMQRELERILERELRSESGSK
jgi:NAD+ synthase (glutamine-hydrolysing)